MDQLSSTLQRECGVLNAVGLGVWRPDSFPAP